jgi:hypothetical protein
MIYNLIFFGTFSNHHFERFQCWNLNDNNNAKKIKKPKKLDFMDKFKWKSQFNGSTTKAKFWLDRIWENILGNEREYGVFKGWNHANVYQKVIFISKKTNIWNKVGDALWDCPFELHEGIKM